MKKIYRVDNVFIKLLIYCNDKKEIYFKRSDVTEYLITKQKFSIPNKQGFDGNLSYFGFDIKNDTDNKRILLLRGKKIIDRCIKGELNIVHKNDEFIINDDDKSIFIEIDNLIKNKTQEAKAFHSRKLVVNDYELEESSTRLFGNKKLYTKNGKYFTFPHIIIDSLNENKNLYEIVNSNKNEKYNLNFIFPYIKPDNSIDYKVFNHTELGELQTDFAYFEYRQIDDMFYEHTIQEYPNEKIIKLINEKAYDLQDKNTTKTVLNTARLNTKSLRDLCLNRDNYRCLLCTIDDSNFLICSHIKPWVTDDGRFDLNNVLTLCTLHDRLFDQGYISFDKNGKILYSKKELFNNELINLFMERSKESLDIKMNDMIRKYLKYHNSFIFK